MELSIQRQQTLRHQFDAYCKKVVKYEMINCYREKERRGKRQVLFSEMSEAQFNLLATFDEYFADEYIFCVVGFNISVKNELLAEALTALTAERRNIGSTTYKVAVHFSKTSTESMNDKIVRLIKSEAENGKAVEE